MVYRLDFVLRIRSRLTRIVVVPLNESLQVSPCLVLSGWVRSAERALFRAVEAEASAVVLLTLVCGDLVHRPDLL